MKLVKVPSIFYKVFLEDLNAALRVSSLKFCSGEKILFLVKETSGDTVSETPRFLFRTARASLGDIAASSDAENCCSLSPCILGAI